MTLKTEVFELPARKGIATLQKKLQKFLNDNDHIDVISTEFAAYNDKIGYILIYRDTFHQPEVIKYDSFQRPPVNPPPAPKAEDYTYQEIAANSPQNEEPPLTQGNAVFEQKQPKRKSAEGFTTDALFGNLKTFE